MSVILSFSACVRIALAAADPPLDLLQYELYDHADVNKVELWLRKPLPGEHVNKIVGVVHKAAVSRLASEAAFYAACKQAWVHLLAEHAKAMTRDPRKRPTWAYHQAAEL